MKRIQKKLGRAFPAPSFGQNPKEQQLFFGKPSLTLLQQNQTVFLGSIEEIERQTNAYFVVRSDDLVWQSIMSLKTISIDALPPTINRSLRAYERLRASVEAASK